MSEPKTVNDAYLLGVDADSTTESAVYVFLRDWGDYPIVQCGDERFVLAVDREELVREVEVYLQPSPSLNISMAQMHLLAERTVDAILAKLSFREVEEIRDNVLGLRRRSNKGPGAYYSDCTLSDGPLDSPRDVALLKPVKEEPDE